jgi:hypothetical protein
MMEAASTFETFVNFYQSTRRNNPEDSHLQSLISTFVQLVDDTLLRVWGNYVGSGEVQKM